MSLVSLTIDAMLPAFNAIANDFKLTNPNDIQLVIAMVFFGMACGIFIYGPLADSYGRKKVCYFRVRLVWAWHNIINHRARLYHHADWQIHSRFRHCRPTCAGFYDGAR